MKKIILILLFFTNKAISAPFDYQLDSLYSYNLINYVYWPKDNKNFTICTIGKKNEYLTNIHSNLKKIIKIKNDTNKVQLLENIEYSKIKECMILYIDYSAEQFVNDIFAQASSYPILTISRISSFSLRGGMVEITTNQEKTEILINKSNIEKNNLSLSSDLFHIVKVIK